jgi:hypothetical protein
MHDAEQRAHRTGRVLKGALTAGAIGLGVAFAGAGLALRDLTRDAIDDEKAMKQTQAVLKSTGGAARVTASDVQSLSTRIALYSGIQDDVVQSGANMLLTFMNLRNEAGKGNDIYSQSVVVLADMSTALGQDMPKSAIQLGKALNDPIKGITALRRVGVAFTDAQKEQIEALVQSGHTMAAQKLILAELRKEFGGSAKAAGDTFAGQLRILGMRLEGIGQGLLEGLIPAVDAGMAALGDLVGFIDKVALAPSLKVGIEIAAEGVRDFGRKIGDQLGRAVRATNWSQVGREIGTAVGAAITFSEDALDGLLSSAFSWFNAHAGEFAELGLVIGLEIVNKLGDPAFWLDHWQLIAIALITIFGGRLFKLGGDLVVRLARGMGGEVAALAEYLAFTLAGKLPPAIGRVFLELVEQAEKWIGRLVGLVGEELAKVPRIFSSIFKFSLVAGFFRLFATAIDHVLGLISTLLGALSHLPFGLGHPFEVAQRSIDGAREKVRELRDEIGRTRGKKVDVDVRFLATDARSPGRSDGLVGAYTGEGSVGAWYDTALSRMAQRAFNAGEIIFPGSSTGGASTGGLKPMILDDLANARRYGLRLTSGYRPGARTSSGNVSLHSLGQAIDVAGPPGAMAMYAQSEAGRSGIAEVIYSPVGWWHPGSGWGPITDATIKRGHYSHVHVGARSGDGLVGLIGDGKKGKKRRPPSSRSKQGRAIVAAGMARGRKKPSVRDSDWGVIPASIDLEIFNAEDTPGTEDDIAAHQHALDFLGTQLRWVRRYGLGPEAELAVRRSIREHESAIKEIKGDAAARQREAIMEGQANVAAGIALEREYGSDIVGGGAWSTQTGGMGSGRGGGGGEQGQGGTTIHVNQNFHKPPEDQHPLMESARFAAESVFG